MELRKIGEFGLIARIRDRLPAFPPQVVEGIGDDAAVTFLSPGMDLVSTVDLLVEGVHFDLSLITPHKLGRKSLAVNLSDIAAMGARPLFSLISLAIPARIGVSFIDDFFAGLGEMAQAHEVALIGGDISSSPGPFFVSITLLGEGNREALVYRHGARPGDDLYVTGTLGDSLLGLYLAKNQGGTSPSPEKEYLLERHFNPSPRVREGRDLARMKIPGAMIDVSDGLFSDLRHICEESRVGAVVWAERVPQSAAFRSFVPAPAGQGWQWALRGGEDYELLFSAPVEKAPDLETLTKDWPCGVTRIGKIEPPSRGVIIRDESGPVDPAVLKGYDHFA